MWGEWQAEVYECQRQTHMHCWLVPRSAALHAWGMPGQTMLGKHSGRQSADGLLLAAAAPTCPFQLIPLPAP